VSGTFPVLDAGLAGQEAVPAEPSLRKTLLRRPSPLALLQAVLTGTARGLAEVFRQRLWRDAQDLDHFAFP